MEKAKMSEIMPKLGNFIKVRPIKSPRSNEAVRNQYEIEFERGYVFQSYDTFIGILSRGQYYLTNKHNCTNTTARWCTEWCGLDTKQRKQGLESGKIILLEDDVD